MLIAFEESMIEFTIKTLCFTLKPVERDLRQESWGSKSVLDENHD
jgi:hypothetical protein